MRELLVSIATAWGSKYGGIDSFNYDICRAIAQMLPDKYSVVCIVEEGNDHDASDARRSQVNLLRVPRDPGASSDEWPSRIVAEIQHSGLGRPIWWIGHDVKTGPSALRARVLTPGTRAAVIAHMDYSSYLGYKHVGEENKRKRVI